MAPDTAPNGDQDRISDSAAPEWTMTLDELRWHMVAYHHRSIGWAATATEAKIQGVHGPLHAANVDTFNGRPDHDHA